MSAKTSSGFSEEEKAAMKERADELKAAKRGGKKNPEADLLAKIAELPPEDRAIAERVHAVVMTAAPDLKPRTWYGMPAYEKDGQVLCFLQAATKFKTRYSTLGFNDNAQLDEGDMWPTAYAVPKVTAAIEKKIATLVTRAVG